jgi:hypothetical protein
MITLILEAVEDFLILGDATIMNQDNNEPKMRIFRKMC